MLEEMKEYNNYSLYSFQQLKVEIDTISQAIANKEFYSLDLYLMEEAEVLQFLKISRATLYKYRKIYNIKTISLFGRKVYFKHQIIDIIIQQFLK